jgi:hypothetical protein
MAVKPSTPKPTPPPIEPLPDTVMVPENRPDGGGKK